MRSERRRAWQRTIAHVPRSIYLGDSTIAQNIAFGVLPEQIDLARVRAAAAQARIADFIESGPCGYDAFIGERGIRLSGGQRQRKEPSFRKNAEIVDRVKLENLATWHDYSIF